ncbi:SUMF1/EgtB/PvdO family nonheme iron enzyme [uncultured Thiodictyon sp.]|uniref:SUMF1/EgtB/PvdO family nonheme iron enzyme n=1 Tax=uncultured Thiodictyon sp. TaxID=1846217 RepID=UPI0034563719
MSSCVLPLFLQLRPLSLRTLYSDPLHSRGGPGETSPVAARSARFFCYAARAGWRHPVRRSGEVVRGGSWNNHRDNARGAYRNRNQPGNRNNNLGFRVVLRSAHVLQPLLLVSPGGGTAYRYTSAGRAPAMRADWRKPVCPPR